MLLIRLMRGLGLCLMFSRFSKSLILATLMCFNIGAGTFPVCRASFWYMKPGRTPLLSTKESFEVPCVARDIFKPSCPSGFNWVVAFPEPVEADTAVSVCVKACEIGNPANCSNCVGWVNEIP